MSTRPLDFERIGDVLQATRARLRGRAALQTLLWSITALGAGLLVLSALAAAMSGGRSFRLFAWTLLLLGAGALVWRFLARPWRRVAADEAVAAHLERGLPDLRDGLIASVQFGREWGVPGAQTPELVAGLADQVAARLADVDLQAQTPLLPNRRPLAAAGGVALLWLVLALIGPAWLGQGLGVLMPARTADGARLVGPLVGDLELTLVYPEYMKRPDRVIPNSTGDFDAPKGTQVRVRATTLQPARALAVKLATGGPEGAPLEVPLALSDARDGQGSFIVTQGGKWRFIVVTEDGETQAEALERLIRLEADNPPNVTLKLPSGDAEIDDLRPIRVEFEGGDDHGVSKVAILLTLAADQDHPDRIEQPGLVGKRVEGGDEIDLARIQAAGGDKIGISVEFFDNNGVDGPQRSVSATRWLTIHSPQKKHQEEMEKLNGLVDAFVTALADRLEMDYRAAAADLPPLPDRVGVYVAETEAPTKTLAEVVTAMKDDKLTPKEVLLALAGRLGTLERALAAEKTTISANSGALASKTDPAIRAVSRANESTIEQVEQTIVLIEALVARLGLEELMALTDEIKASTQRLRSLIQDYKQAPTDALKQRIRRDIQRLKSRIQEIRERIAKLRQKLPEEFLNMEGLKDNKVAEGLEKTESQLDDLDKMLEENRLDDALKAIEDMEQSLEELSKQLDEDMDDLNQETNPEMQKAISELMDQTRDLMKQQQELNDATDNALKEYEDCLGKILSETLKGPYDSLLERGGKVRGIVERIDPDDVPSYMRSEIDEAGQRADQFNAALVAARAGGRAGGHRAPGRLRGDPGARRADGRHRVRAAATRDALAQGKALSREIARDAANAAQAVRRHQAPRVRAETAAHGRADDAQPAGAAAARRNGRAAAAAGPAGRSAAESGAAPAPGGRGRPPVARPHRSERRAHPRHVPRDGSEGRQRRAGHGQSRRGPRSNQRPGEARPSQRQAMNELEGIMQGLKQAASPQRADRGQGERDGEGRRMSRRKVEIPGADAHESPAEFRKDLLDAMKDKAPEAFEEQVKRYYETLVE
jgi:predicted  nucleic acid-binding Zn-ribbon protein